MAVEPSFVGIEFNAIRSQAALLKEDKTNYQYKISIKVNISFTWGNKLQQIACLKTWQIPETSQKS